MNTGVVDPAVEASATPPTVPPAIVAAYFDRPDKDEHPSMRKRIAIALRVAKKNRKLHVKLQAADVNDLLVQANLLWLLQQEVRKVIEESGTPYAGLAREVQAALADRALLNRMERACLTVTPASVEALPDGALQTTAWFARKDAVVWIAPSQRAHRHLREALYDALNTELEPFVPAGEAVTA